MSVFVGGSVLEQECENCV